MPINRAEKEPEKKWIIKVEHHSKTYWCYWWEFLEAINHQIEETTHSEDKQLGYFFAKPKSGENFISTDTFVNKVIFYLWNDVFKDEDSAVFQYGTEPIEDVAINCTGNMYFRHFMESTDEMIHYFINQLFAMGKSNNPVVPIDYLKNDNDSRVKEHLPKMREGNVPGIPKVTGDKDETNGKTDTQNRRKRNFNVSINGQPEFSGDDAAKTFLKALNQLGPEKISKLGLTLNSQHPKVPFIKKGKYELSEYDASETDETLKGYIELQRELDNDFWVMTKYDTDKKITKLKEIAEKLDVEINITEKLDKH